MKFFVYLAVLVGLTMVSTGSVSAATYYVATSGNDTNSGTQTSPWRTIQKGVSVLNPGDFLYVKRGTYLQTNEVNISRSGTASAPITIMTDPADAPAKAVISGDVNGNKIADDGYNYYFLVKLDGSYINFKNFEVEFSARYGIRIEGSNNVISGNNVHHLRSSGISIHGPNNIVENNTVWRADESNCCPTTDKPYECNVGTRRECSGNWPGGIVWGDTSGSGNSAPNAIIRHNTVFHNSGEGIICMPTDGGLVEDNVSYDNWALNIDIDQCSNTVVQRNLVYYSADKTWWRYGGHPGHGIMLSNEGWIGGYPLGSNRQVINNIIIGSNFRYWGISSGSALKNDLIANNTIIESQNMPPFMIDNPVSPASHQNTRFVNNLILQSSGSLASVATTVGLSFNHNLWSRTPPSNVYNSSSDKVGNPNLSAPNSPPCTLTRTYPDPAHPGYVYETLSCQSPTGIELTSSSILAIDQAAAIPQVTDDYFSASRGGSPDIGAHEYGGSGQTTNPGDSSGNGQVDIIDDAPLLPTSIYPRTMGFTPLLYHCRQETRPEFHPLRPYPASPCDPLIPRKIPRADQTVTRLYLTPYCGKSLNVHGTVAAPDAVDATGGQVTNFPTAWADATLDKLYFCLGSTTDICFTKRISFAVTWDFDRSQLPIVGNTQDPLQDVQKVNQYLDWYLNGTVQQSEQLPLDVANPAIAQRLTTFGGPVKKLLPFDAQVDLKDILVNTNVRTEYHAYDIKAPTWVNTPFSSLEDITAEATVGIYTEGQPTSPEISGRIVSIGLTVGSADSRLYFPHLKSSKALSDLLSSLIRPLPNQITSSNPDVVSQKILPHQGTVSVEGDTIPGVGNDNTVVQSRPRDYPSYPNTVSRNTEVIENSPAPDPILTYSEQPGGSQLCDLPAPIKPGDDLVGSQVHGTLSYVQLFQYTPQLIVADSCAGRGANCRDNCLRADNVCSTSATPCCYGSCPSASSPYCDGPDSAFFPCSGRVETDCVSPCTWEIPTTSCPAWPPPVNLNTAARAATFTKTPLVDKIYDTLVIGSQSLLRRFLPQKPTTLTGEYLEGETDLKNAKPVGTTANYSGNSSDVTNPSVDAGSGGSGAIYFPRLQSLYRHFLGGNIDLNTNLQCLLRPLGQCESTLTCSNVFDSFPENTGACGVCNADSVIGPLAQKIFARAAEEFHVPASAILATMLHEGGDWPAFAGQFTDDNVRKWSLPKWCGGEDMPTCNNDDAYVAQPPFGWIRGYFYGSGTFGQSYWDAVQTVDPSRDTPDKVSRCNFMDAAFATAKALNLNSILRPDAVVYCSGTRNSCPVTHCGTTEIKPPAVQPTSCDRTTQWIDTTFVSSQLFYAGYCPDDTNGYPNPPYAPGEPKDEWMNTVVSNFHTYSCP